MVTVTDININFNFSRGNETRTECVEFNACDGSLESSTIDNHRDELLDDLNVDIADNEEDWAYDGFDVEEFDDDFADPADFDDLDDYGAYAELVEKHGVAYHLRYEDVGDNEFSDEYQGAWDSDKAFAQHILDDCYEVPKFLNGYVDMERWTRDLMMDYSSYDDCGMVHIFRS